MSIRLDNMAATRQHSIPLYLALIAAGLIGNYFKFSILNADFIFGSIFAMLALQLLGPGRGTAAAAIIAGYTYFAWNHPYAILTMTAEAAVVGFLINRKNISLLTADALYWLFMGIPLGYFCFSVISDLPSSNSFFLMTKQAINGITNALLARLIYILLAFRSEKSLISFREIILNLLAFFVLFTELIMLTMASRADFAETDRQIRTMLAQNSGRVAERMDSWVMERTAAIVALAEMAASRSPEQMQPYLEIAKKSDLNFLRIGLHDREATTVAYIPLLDELGKRNIGRNFADRPFIPILKQNLKPMLTEVALSKVGIPQPRVGVVAPVLLRGEYNGFIIGILSLEQMRDHLDKSTDHGTSLYTLLDKNGNVIMTNRKDQQVMKPFSRGPGEITRLDSTISQRVPALPPNTSTINLWGKSLYIAESPIGSLAEWKLVLEQPVAPFQKILYDRYAGRITLLFILFFVALATAELMSRRIAATNERLSTLTHDLPAKLATSSTIMWPETGILDSSNLIANFKGMADELSARFNEIRQLNASLEQRVEERTQALQASEARLQSIIDNSPTVVILKDVNGCYITVNRHFEALFHVTRQTVLGKSDHDLFPQDYADKFRQHDLLALEKGGPVEIEELVPQDDGLHTYISAKFPLFDASGKPYAVCGVATDITARKRVEDELRDKEELLRESQNVAGLGSYVLDVSTGVWQCSAMLNTLFGIDDAFEHSVEGWAALMHPDDRTMMVEYLKKDVLGEGRLFDKEYRIIRHDTRSERWVHGLGKLHVDAQGRPLKMYGTIQDITERKQAEEEKAKLQAQLLQSQKMEAIGQLAGGVAHDFNNMLGVILGHTEIALERVSPGQPLHAHLQGIRNAAERSADLTRQLLAFARKQTVSLKVLDLNETIDGMLKMLRRLIGEDIHLVWIPHPALWLLKIDPSQIDQILANLCVNARDAIAGVGKITIETGNISCDEAYCADHAGFVVGDYVMLAVSDDGCGMDKETAGKLFEPFFTTKEKHKGTGLGLATIYGIVKQNKGFINVYSEPSAGTTFKIYLPRHVGEAEPARAEKPRVSAMGGHETVLLVEDEPSLLELNRVVIEGQGYRVLAAGSPAEAIHLAKEHDGEIHLLVTDVILPEMNGRDLSLELLFLHPNLKCLFTSGYTANVIAHHGVLDDGVFFIQKPFSREDFITKVREVLDQK